MLRVDDCVVLRRVSMGGGEENPEPPIPTQSLNRRASRISNLKNELVLHEAVIKNDVEAVREVMKEPLDVNSRNNYGRAPIHWASSRGNIEIMEMLIAGKCDIEAKDKYGMRPILMAAWHGHREAVQLLINHGADVSAVNKKQYTLLMCAARNNRLEVVNFLLDNLDRVDLDAIDIDHQTALHHAAIGGHIEIVQKLVHVGANPTTVDKRGDSPLHSACAKGHLEVVDFLLHHDANILVQDEDGNTPLHVAVENRQTHVVQLLLEDGNPTDLQNNKGQTPLHISASQGSKGITELLVQYGCDINAQSKNGNTALHNACLSNNAHIVEFLLSKNADINALNCSPIHIAAEQGYTEICKLLLAAGANIQQREQGGKTPLYIAARGSFTAIVDMIIRTARLEYPSNSNDNHAITRRQSRWSQGPDFDLLGPKENNERFLEVLWKLSHKYLEPGEWKKLAYRWNFTAEQIKAIEHQYTGKRGPSSYKEHCHRMLRIWVDSLPPTVDAVQELAESLIAINKEKLADTIIRKMQEPDNPRQKTKHCCDKECIVM
ncbi:ankyrin repeat and death domain-containing protein 1A-like isoform X3 [Planococcus citri]|uniref:ankyrin repeat and death domain-containing protein 1A-like isoform X3 n=1 Tax=Planococcus citri TaxID=170843 RepID=UPI0031F9E367